MLQSLGFLVSLSMYSAFLYRLMTQKLPLEAARPGMFISVGPAAFTSAGVIGMARTLPYAVGPNFMGTGMGEMASKISVIMANWWGIWLWALACWWFLVSCGAHFGPARKGKMQFAMTWFSFIFPNTALTTSTFSVSIALHGDLATKKGAAPRSARPFQVLGCMMTVGLVLMWFFVVAMMIRAIITRQILWPQMQEDRDEGGWGKDRKARKGEANSAMQSSVKVNQNWNGDGRLPTSPVRSESLTVSPVVGEKFTTSSVGSGTISTSPVRSGSLTTSPMESGRLTTSPVGSVRFATSAVESGRIPASPVQGGLWTVSTV